MDVLVSMASNVSPLQMSESLAQTVVFNCNFCFVLVMIIDYTAILQ